MRTIYISDLGTASKATIERGGKITEVSSGGCPIEDILRGVWNHSDGDRLAEVVLRRWMRGYDGDPAENRLWVEVSDEDGRRVGYAEA